MFEVREKPQLVERALLVGVYLDKSKEKEASSLLDELNELVQTLDIGIMDSVLVKVRENFPSHLMGKGKMAEIIERSQDLNCCLLYTSDAADE